MADFDEMLATREVALREAADYAREQGDAAKNSETIALDAAHRADTMGDLRTFLARLGGERMAPGTLRWRIGRRLYATLDAVGGFRFYKLTAPASMVIDDKPDVRLVDRLLSATALATTTAIATVLRPVGAETLPSGGMRWRIGRRLYATLDAVSGFRFYRLTIPATTVMDDQPTTPLASRLLAGGIVSMFSQLSPELGGGFRVRIGKRLAFRWTLARGFEAPRMTLSADTRMADDMTRTLGERLLAAGAVSNLALVVSYGDSRTAGAGAGAPNRFPEYMTALLAPYGITSTNRGIGGQTSIQIAARQGGWPLRLSVAGNAIPASGDVAITAFSTDIFFSSGNAFAAGSHLGTLAGVPGTYASAGSGAGGLTFTRTTAGAAVAIKPFAPFIPDAAKASWSAIHYICIGTNGAGKDEITGRVGDSYDTVRLSLAMAQQVRAKGGIPIVASVIGRNPNLGDDPTANLQLNGMLKNAHGQLYLDILTPPTDEEIATANAALAASVGTITLTAQDQADRTAGYWPRQFYVDTVHLNSWAQYIAALRFVRLLIALGIIPATA